MTTVAIVYHSGFGHTRKVAEALAAGAAEVSGTDVWLWNETEGIERLDELDAADAIVFGCPTYMGGPSTEYKRFIDATGRKWASQSWRDTIAGGFTNSGSYSGDKLATLQAFSILAAQHGMIWVGQTEMPTPAPGNHGSTPEAVNRIGSFLGMMAQSDDAAPEISPPAGDLETARRFGVRVATAAARWRAGDA